MKAGSWSILFSSCPPARRTRDRKVEGSEEEAGRTGSEGSWEVGLCDFGTRGNRSDSYFLGVPAAESHSVKTTLVFKFYIDRREAEELLGRHAGLQWVGGRAPLLASSPFSLHLGKCLDGSVSSAFTADLC